MTAWEEWAVVNNISLIQRYAFYLCLWSNHVIIKMV